MGHYFPAKSAEIIVLSLIFGLPGILPRIQRIHRKRAQLSRTDPRFPTPGGRMTVLSLPKLPQMTYGGRRRTTLVAYIWFTGPWAQGLPGLYWAKR